MFKHLLSIVALAAASAVSASPVEMEFEADGFQNAGVQHPGFSGPISGSFTWEPQNPADVHSPVAHFLAIDLKIAGHTYTLSEIGIANQGTTQTAFGALARGANAVVGDGAFDDFLIVFDRVNPRFDAFAYSIAGKNGAIWWTPTRTSVRFVDANNVPEPSALMLAGLALAGVGIATTRRRRETPAAVAVA